VTWCVDDVHEARPSEHHRFLSVRSQKVVVAAEVIVIPRSCLAHPSIVAARVMHFADVVRLCKQDAFETSGFTSSMCAQYQSGSGREGSRAPYRVLPITSGSANALFASATSCAYLRAFDGCARP
jgi:hypothetical protein